MPERLIAFTEASSTGKPDPQAWVHGYEDGESYVCRYFASYESENSGELDIEMDDPRYDEFYQVAMNVVETVRTGVRGYQDGFTLDYRDWPALIKDVDRGTVVYPELSN